MPVGRAELKSPQQPDFRSRSDSWDCATVAREPHGAARENLKTALALALIGQAKLNAAAVLGRNGGASGAKGGSKCFQRLAAKHKAAGRERNLQKPTNSPQQPYHNQN
jgi:hypothetical protein